MAYHGCPPGWKPDYMEAEKEGGKSVLDQVMEARARYAAEQAKEETPAGVYEHGVDLGAKPATAVKVVVEPAESVSEMVAETERKPYRPR